jgi:MFS family permease
MEVKKAGRKNIILLGLVSFITDASSETIFPLLPFFIAALLVMGGGSAEIGLFIGIIGGLAPALSSILKAVSGYWSDKIHRKKPFVAAGYAISSTSKIFFPLSSTAGQVAIVQIVERSGKGLRDAPRDAIIAESAEEKKGMGFGIHRALDSAGAVVGTVIALTFLLIFHPTDYSGNELLNVLRITFFFAAGLAFFALIPLIFVKEKEGKVSAKYKLGIRNLPRQFWYALFITGLFAFANFTYMFFVFQTSDFFPAELKFIVPLALYVLFNIIYTGLSIPAGSLSDRFGKGTILIIGYGFFTITCLTFIFSTTLSFFIIGFCLYGVSLAFIDGVERAFISDMVSPEIRGTALGTFHMVIGIAALPAGFFAGLLYDINPSLTFLYGTVIGVSSVFILFLLLRFRLISKKNQVI